MTSKPTGAGKSSFELIDQGRFFERFRLPPGARVLDLACGRGAYSLAIAERLEGGGWVLGVDLWEEGAVQLAAEAAARSLPAAAVVGHAGRVPVADGCIDAVLIATALHDFVRDGAGRAALSEAARVLRPQGLLAVVEFKKIDGPPGPPIQSRMAPAEVARLAAACGFAGPPEVELGPFTYLMTFRSDGGR